MNKQTEALAEQPAQPQPCSKCKGLGYYDEGHECDDGSMASGNYVECDKCKQPAQPQQEPVAWADECRIELVNAIHFLASDFENALGAFGGDTEARRKAEGDIAHARSIASRWNWNGASPPAQRKPLRNEWQPSETGPQDGTPCLVYWGQSFGVPLIGVARRIYPYRGEMLWHGHGGSHNEVTHWMPLPDAPIEATHDIKGNT